jgi:hypothetical protein
MRKSLSPSVRVLSDEDANLHKYLDISQTFNESKNLLGDNAKHVRSFLSHVESTIDRHSKEFEDLSTRENK